MSRIREFEINDFLGIASSKSIPQKNQCKECQNFDLRYKQGDLYLRPGFIEKYPTIANADHRSKLSSMTYLGFANFIPEGTTTEVTVWVVKATLAGESGTLNGTPSSINILTVFTSHYYNGTSWIAKNWDGTTNGKYWLNHCVLTSITLAGIGANAWEITLDMNTNQFANDSLNNWTVYNVDKDDIAQVIDSVLTGSSMRIDITKSVHDWEAEDTLILMRNYIPYEYLTGMYSCVAGDITFHKVLNDLRIGFGGQSGRIGLSIGYRKRYFNIKSLDFGSYTTQIEGLSTVNNIVLDTYLPIVKHYGLLVQTTTGIGGSNVAEGKYFFKMTGVLDGFQEVLLAESTFTLSPAGYLKVTPMLMFGGHNKRLTTLKIYVSAGETTDTEPTNPFFLLEQFVLSKDSYSAELFSIDTLGHLYNGFSQELMTTQNAVIDSATDYDSTSGFSSPKYSFDTVIAADPEPNPQQGTYALKCIAGAGSTGYGNSIAYTKTGLFKKGERYSISVYAVAKTNTQPFGLFLGPNGTGSIGPLVALSDTTWTELTAEFIAPIDSNSLYFAMYGYSSGDWVMLDSLSIQLIRLAGYNADRIPATGVDVVDALGYQPTFDMIKSWDQAVVTQGRAFFVNPYIDQRYENKIFSSHISGAGAFMYDAASAERYIDLENFDGNNLVGIEVLPNLDFLALKKNSAQYVDPNTGRSRGIHFIDGAIARRSIVNFGDRVVWCGENDIYMSDGLNVVSLTEGTIREDYRALTNKANIVATREEVDNAYRFFTGDTSNKTEYILTKRGWIKRVNGGSGIYPEVYAKSKDGTVFFLRSGIIYYEDENGTDAGGNLGLPIWTSIDFDAEKMGEGLRRTDFFYLNSVWIDYSQHLIVSQYITIGVYIDGTLFQEFQITTTAAVESKKIVRPLKLGAIGKKFYVKVEIEDATYGIWGTSISIHSVGVLWTPVTTRTI